MVKSWTSGVATTRLAGWEKPCTQNTHTALEITTSNTKSAPRPVLLRSNMTMVKLYYRNVHGDGHVMMIAGNETVGDLKGSVVEQLKDSWGQQDPPFQLKKKHIRIYRVLGGELETIEDDATRCNDEWVYLALEVFVDEMPLMLRTVGFDQLNPVVLTHPDVNRDYTNCAPIYCAAMSAAESKTPTLSLQILEAPIVQQIHQEDAEEKKLDDEEGDVKAVNANLVQIVDKHKSFYTDR